MVLAIAVAAGKQPDVITGKPNVQGFETILKDQGLEGVSKD